jgi:hypothetical protein
VKRLLSGILIAALWMQPAQAGSVKKDAAPAPSKAPAKVAEKVTQEDSSSPVPAVKPITGETNQAPDVLREKKYFYSSFGTRDPFRSLVDGVFEAKLQDLVDVHTVTLVGVLYEEDEYVAMLQDSGGFGYNLRPGDRVRNGTVVSVGKDALVARLNVFGQTTRVTLRLQREE